MESALFFVLHTFLKKSFDFVLNRLGHFFVKNKLRQKPWTHFLYLLIPNGLYLPNFYITVSLPASLILNVGLAIGNLNKAQKQNKKLYNDLKRYDLKNKTILPNRTLYGLICTKDKDKSPISVEIVEYINKEAMLKIRARDKAIADSIQYINIRKKAVADSIKEANDYNKSANNFYKVYCDCIERKDPNSLSVGSDIMECLTIDLPNIKEEDKTTFSNDLTKYIHVNCPKYYLLQNRINNLKSGKKNIISDIEKNINHIKNETFNIKNIKFTNISNNKSGDYFTINDSLKFSYFNDEIIYISKIKWITDLKFEEIVISDLLPNEPPFLNDVIYNKFIEFRDEYYLLEQEFSSIKTKVLLKKL
jgi:uncharacterized protein YegJ (DUF2314 family)